MKTPRPKPDKHTTTRLQVNIPDEHNAKSSNKITTKSIQTNIKKIIHNDQVGTTDTRMI